jgi:hypothetical protein
MAHRITVRQGNERPASSSSQATTGPEEETVMVEKKLDKNYAGHAGTSSLSCASGITSQHLTDKVAHIPGLWYVGAQLLQSFLSRSLLPLWSMHGKNKWASI